MRFRVRIGQSEGIFEVEPGRGSTSRVAWEGRALHADLCQVGPGPLYSLLLDGKSYQFFVQEEEGALVIVMAGQVYPARVVKGDAMTPIGVLGASAAPSVHRVVAPLPGLVVQVLVAVGDRVEHHAPLVVVESMKMNNPLRAPSAAKVKAIHVQPGQRVERGQVLVELE